ncbi:8885_t:CDS:1, partial [Rhizophagus irregularis]
KKELELVIKAQLMVFEITNEKSDNTNSNTQRYRYCYNASLPLCKPAFLKLCGINDYLLGTLQNHLHTEGLSERIHENIGRIPMTDNRVFLNSEITFPLKQFLVQYSCIHGLPSPLRHRNDSNTFIYLPTDRTYTSVYKEYKDYYYTEHDESNQIISYYTFRRLWIEMMPYLKFQAPASDLCEICEGFKAKIKVAKSDADEHEKVQIQYENHQKLAKLERQHYNDNIEKSKNDLTIAHVCYDWAQNVFIPYSPQQVSSIYFKSAFSVHLFGVCKTEGGQNHQLNFVIGENELPKGTSKGANTTINMVYNSLQKFAQNGKKHLQITCDNCTGQNKNNLSLWFWSWLVMLNWYEDITVNFMIPSHTKFICDSFFGHIKKVYWKHKVNTINDVKNIINNSSNGNEAILYDNGINWNWYDFSAFFKNHFVPLPNITQFHHFRFSSEDIGKIYVSKESGGVELCYKLLKSDNFNKNSKPDLITTVSLTEERQNYLYSKIRQYVDEPYKDEYCAKPK